MKRVAVFCSGGGSDFQSIIDANEKDKFCDLCLMIASKPNIMAIDRANEHGIKSVVVDKNDYSTLEETFQKIDEELEKEKIDFIVLAGYLSILDEKFVAKRKGKIINIHPSLIPSFCGKGYYGLKVHEAAIERGVKVSGATVHFVDEGADTGKIIMQQAVEVLDDDTAESLQKRILETEHKMLPIAVKGLVEGKYKL